MIEHSAEFDATAALSRLVDQAFNTAGDDPGRARVMEDYRVVAEALDRLRALVAPQWRPIPNDLPDATAEAFSAGRNWMIDRIREALDTSVIPAEGTDHE